MSKSEYIGLVAEVQNLPVFFEPWFLDICAAESTWDVVLHKNIEEDNSEVLVWPYFIKRKWGMKYISMPHFCKYMGPYNLSGLPFTPQKINKLYASLPSFSFLDINTHYAVSEACSGYFKKAYKTRFSYQIDPGDKPDADLIWKNISTDYQNNKIKKARKIVDIVENISIDEAIELNQASFGRQGKDLHAPEVLEKLMEMAIEKGRGILFGAKDAKGRIHATLFLLWDQERVYYHSGGTDPDLRSSGAGIYIIWHAIEWALKNHIGKKFDFLGSSIPGIARVWKNFGAEQIEYGQLSIYRSIFAGYIRLIVNKLRKD